MKIRHFIGAAAIVLAFTFSPAPTQSAVLGSEVTGVVFVTCVQRCDGMMTGRTVMVPLVAARLINVL